LTSVASVTFNVAQFAPFQAQQVVLTRPAYLGSLSRKCHTVSDRDETKAACADRQAIDGLGTIEP